MTELAAHRRWQPTQPPFSCTWQSPASGLLAMESMAESGFAGPAVSRISDGIYLPGPEALLVRQQPNGSRAGRQSPTRPLSDPGAGSYHCGAFQLVRVFGPKAYQPRGWWRIYDPGGRPERHYRLDLGDRPGRRRDGITTTVGRRRRAGGGGRHHVSRRRMLPDRRHLRVMIANHDPEGPGGSSLPRAG